MKRCLMGVAAVLGAAGFALASAGAGAGITADQALQSLMDGNKRYVESRMKACAASDSAAREKLARGQKPYAIILSCSDSRVPPEIVFDTSMGEIFVVRVAGNIPDPVIVGSIEYAAEHLGSPLVMVLGHERCGAVTAAVETRGKAPGNIDAIVRTIKPAVARAKKIAAGKEKGELVECAAEQNVKLTAANLTKQSGILAHLEKEGKVKIVAAKYDLDDGKVTLLK